VKDGLSVKDREVGRDAGVRRERKQRVGVHLAEGARDAGELSRRERRAGRDRTQLRGECAERPRERRDHGRPHREAFALDRQERRVEVAVEVPIGANDTPRFGFHALGEAIEDEVMRRFDHRNLNLDFPEFATLNPSVEHIAFVCHDLLAPRIARDGAKLRFVRVWETDKTSCRYPA
jgi:hypothetical protein